MGASIVFPESSPRDPFFHTSNPPRVSHCGFPTPVTRPILFLRSALQVLVLGTFLYIIRTAGALGRGTAAALGLGTAGALALDTAATISLGTAAVL